MRKSRILMAVIACLVALSLAPAAASAAQAPASNDSPTSLTAASTVSATSTMKAMAKKQKPKLNLTKVTLPGYSKKNGNHHMVLQVSGASKVKWSTSNKKVVSFDKYSNAKNKIHLQANKKGKAVITAKVGKKTLKCKVTVTKPMSEKKLAKKIKVDASTVGQQYITIKNTSKYHLKVIARVRMMNDNGVYTGDWCDTHYVKLEPGKSQKAYVSNLYGYTKCTYTLESVFTDYEYFKMKGECALQPVVDRTLPVVATNKAKFGSYLYVTVFFKKDGKIVWAEQKDTNSVVKPGKSKTLEFFLHDNIPAYDSISWQVTR